MPATPSRTPRAVDLLKIWSQGAKTQQHCAASSLMQLGSDDPDSIPALVHASQTAIDANIRRGATQALARIGPVSPTVVPAVIAALHDTEVQVQLAAARAFQFFGAAGEPAIPALLEILRSARGVPVRDAAAIALARLCPFDSGILPKLVAFLVAPAVNTRYAAALALGSAGPEWPEVVPGLILALGDTEEAVNALAANWLESFGAAAAEALPALCRLRESPSPFLVDVATGAIAAIRR